MEPLSRSRILGRVLVLVILIGLAGGALFALKRWENKRDGGNATEEVTLQEEKKMIRYKNRWYELRDNIETVLVIGLDKFSSQVERNSYNNDQRADFMLLLMVDKDNKKINAIHINRDTMAEIQVLGVAGQVVDTTHAQLALSYNYGSGGHDSCRNTMKAVSTYLYDLPIDYYVSVTMDAVSELNDLVEGVTITVMDDFSALYPEMVQGAEVTLTGEQALSYVRARTSLEDKTNMHRMERQRQYINALYNKIKQYAASSDDFALEVMTQLSAHMITNYSVSSLQQLSEYLMDFELLPVSAIEGEATVGEEFMEFYPDEDALKEMLVNTFYTPSEEKVSAESPS